MCFMRNEVERISEKSDLFFSLTKKKREATLLQDISRMVNFLVRYAGEEDSEERYVARDIEDGGD